MNLTDKDVALILALLAHYESSIEAGLKHPDLTAEGRKQYQLNRLEAAACRLRLEGVARAA